MTLTNPTPRPRGHRNAPRRPALAALLLALCWLLSILPAQAADSNAEPVDDVRVLIDISGSMKRTDPHNLRRPALRLFTTLLPAGTRAGVWTFGQWTNMLVKHGPVDTAWKDRAREATGEISSLGLYTNIEDVLKRATWDWKRPDAASRRSLILLTDGLVDIARNPAENTASRERILNHVLPRLQQAGVTVHTIALSDESDADLLRQLAAATGGWFETIESADGLERLFLRLFEKVSQADTLPLTDNKVNIDNSIHEATFLVFRQPGSPPTTVTAPDGSRFGQQQLPAGVAWFEDERYDLITVQNPPPGEWHINADLDPDNRVMVVTDLRLKNTQLPNDLSVNQPLLFTAQLEQKGKIIDRPDFLQFVKITLTQVSDSGDEWQWRLRDDGKQADLTANDGIFSTRLGESLIEGEHEFILDVDGITFKRNQRQRVKVYGQPVDAQLVPLGHDRFALTIVPYVSLIDPRSLHIEIEHILPNGRLQTAEVPQVSSAEWRLELDASGHMGEHELTAHISGQRSDGSPLSVQLGPIYFEANGEAAPHQRAPLRAPEPKPEPLAEAPTAQPTPRHEPEPAHAPPVQEQEPAPEHENKPPAGEEHTTAEAEPPPQISWGLIIGSIIGLTALIGALVFAGIKLWPKLQALRNRKKEAPDEVPDREEKKEAPAAAATAATAATAAEAEETESDGGVPDVDQAIDELLGDSKPQEGAQETVELDPELDLASDDDEENDTGKDSAKIEDTLEMDISEESDALEKSEEKNEATATETSSEEAQEIAEIPEDLISLDDDDGEDKTQKT